MADCVTTVGYRMPAGCAAEWRKVAQSKSQIPVASAARIHQRAQQTIATLAPATPGENGAQTVAGEPALRPPQQAVPESLDHSARLLLMLVKMGLESSALATEDLKTRLALLSNRAQARSTQAQKMSAQLDALLAGYQQQVQQAQLALQTLEQQQGQLQQSQAALTDLQAQLAALPPTAAGEQAQLLHSEIATLQERIVRQQGTVQQATQQALTRQEAAQLALEQIDRQVTEMDARFADIPAVQMGEQKSAVEQSQAALNAFGTMIQLLGGLIKQLGENASERLAGDMALNNQRASARQHELERQAKHYEEQLRKAEEVQKTAGCIGKILGGVAIALGAVTSVFGGGGVGLMAVGIGLMAADAMTEAVSGQSLIGMALNPVIEHVLLPMMRATSDLTGKLFDITPLGLLLRAVEKATGAEFMGIVHNVVSAAVAIATLVAVAMLAKSGVKFLLEKMGQGVGEAMLQTIKTTLMETVQRLLPQLIKRGAGVLSATASQVMQKLSQQLAPLMEQIGKMLGELAPVLFKHIGVDNPQQLNRLLQISVNRLNYVEHGVLLGNTSVSSGLNITAADIEQKMATILAGFKLTQLDISQIRQDIQRALSNFRLDERAGQQLRQDMNDMLRNNQRSARQTLRNIAI